MLIRTRPERGARRAWCARTAIALYIGALLAGGAATGAESPPPGRPYAGRTVCCKDPAQFSYVALPDRGRVEFDLDRKSPLFEFQTGYSVFGAFRLPVMSEPYLIEIRSYLRGGPDPERAQVLYPIAAFLSDDYLVMRSIGLDAVVPELPLSERAGAPAYRVAIPVDPARGQERYLVLYTPYELVMPNREIELPPTLDAVDGSATGAFLGASSEGHLSITIVTAHGAASR